jgi:hypothetical protein
MIRERNVQDRPEQRRVPDCDIVEIGPAPGSEAEPLHLGESDRAKPVRRGTLALVKTPPSERRDLTRLLTALLILELGFFGALYMGQRYAEAQVIVVPATADDRSVLT